MAFEPPIGVFPKTKLEMGLMDQEEELRKAFKVLDYENRGYISRQDLKHFMTKVGDKLSEKEITEMIQEADPNNTGKIQYENYIKVLML